MKLGIELGSVELIKFAVRCPKLETLLGIELGVGTLLGLELGVKLGTLLGTLLGLELGVKLGTLLGTQLGIELGI